MDRPAKVELGDVVNIPNLVTVLGYTAGAAWAMGGPWWLGALAILAKEADHRTARHLGDRALIAERLDAAVDIAMMGMILQRLRAPAYAFPAAAAAQLAIDQNHWEPQAVSVRSLVLGAAMLKVAADQRGHVTSLAAGSDAPFVIPTPVAPLPPTP
jgi:hypothetical protein